MKNYLRSGNGHLKSLETPLLKDISEAMNKTIKNQMEMSTEMYDSLIGVTTSKEKTNPIEGIFSMKLFKSNADLFAKNVEIFSDLAKKMMGFSYDTFYKDYETNSFSNKMPQMLTEIFEKQTKQIEKLNNNFLEAIEKYTKETSIDSSPLIENIKNSLQENLDLSLNVTKTILNPNNKIPWAEMNKQMDSILKSNLTFWSDLLISINKGTEKEEKENHHEKMKETKKEPLETHKK